ncbi:MAG: Rho termination factor N-terminal domain-containing protein, partial [Longimicrobiaceae bacterium]
MARDTRDGSTAVRSDRPPLGEPVDITALKSKTIPELHELAGELNISNFSGLRKQDLIYRIEQNLLDSEVVLRGEG